MQRICSLQEFLSEEMMPDMQEVGVAGHSQIDNYCTCLTGWCKLKIHIQVNLGHLLSIDMS